MNYRVLFVDHSAELGGAELCLLDILRCWPTCAQIVLFSDGPLRERLEQLERPVVVLNSAIAVKRIRRDSGLLRALKSAPGLFRLSMKLAKLAVQVDVIYANSQKAFITSALAAFVVRRRCIWHLHDILSKEHFNPLAIRLIVMLANRLAAKVIVNSDATARAFIAAGGKRSKHVVVYNGFDLSVWNGATQSLENRDEPWCNRHPLIGVFSRLAPWKGQHVLIEALKTLPQVEAIVVGSALFGEDAYEQSLRQQVAGAGLRARVHFLGFRHDIGRLMQMVDIVVHCSIAPEPFGRVVVEGMLAGRPVIASHGGGITELIEDGTTGFIVPPNNPIALAEAIRTLIEDEQLAQQMGKRAAESARERFNIEKIVQETVMVVEDVSRRPQCNNN